ncbi:hypothetical protein IFO70_35110 [Phormidium tenue FACHB-886]|nr:hypothetical protein [Phormidium tenue FACHB-886]
MKRLTLPNKRCRVMCWFWGRGLALNRGLLEHNWLGFDRALKIQSWLIDRVGGEHKLACQAHMQVLETCFLTGELAATSGNLDYFYDLRALYVEGRYETLLRQIYQLDLTEVMDEDGNDQDALSTLDEL